MEIVKLNENVNNTWCKALSVEYLTMPTWSRPRDLISPRLIKTFTLIIFIHPLRFCVVILFTKRDPYIIRSYLQLNAVWKHEKRPPSEPIQSIKSGYYFNFLSAESKSISRRGIFSSFRRKKCQSKSRFIGHSFGRTEYGSFINGTFENRTNRLFSCDVSTIDDEDGTSPMHLGVPFFVYVYSCRSIIFWSIKNRDFPSEKAWIVAALFYSFSFGLFHFVSFIRSGHDFILDVYRSVSTRTSRDIIHFLIVSSCRYAIMRKVMRFPDEMTECKAFFDFALARRFKYKTHRWIPFRLYQW